MLIILATSGPHNDSQNGTEVYLVDSVLKSHSLVNCGGENRDWEDITVGPGHIRWEKLCLCRRDRDNDGKYRFKRVYRFEEPVLKESTKSIDIISFDTIIFRLPKKKDAETLLIDPSEQKSCVVSKREYPVHLYELQYPYSTRDTLNAKK